MSGNMLSLFFSCLLSGALYLSTRAIWWVRGNRKPRFLIAKGPILMRGKGVPMGLVCIDKVRVREGDTILLTAQTNPSTNGIWTGSKDAWKRKDFSNVSGGWLVTNSGDLWLKNVTLDAWVQVVPLERLTPLDSTDFSPNNPAEAAAYLLRLGILPNQILPESRVNCIRSLVATGFLTESLGGLFLAKPENLVTNIEVATGVSALLGYPTWSNQVTSHMLSIQATNRLLALQREAYPQEQTSFTSKALVDFEKIENKLGGNQSIPIERRSRYHREPLI